MLIIEVPANELFNEATEEFINTKKQVLQLEHSLISISKWESKWHKVFLSKTPKTNEQVIDYVRCMTINANVEPQVYSALTSQNLMDIDRYINDPMSATFFAKEKESPGGEPMTSELIYYWLVHFQIPWEVEKWHLNRLLNLIRIAKMKTSTKNKRSKRDIMSQNAALNAARREAWGTSG